MIRSFRNSFICVAVGINLLISLSTLTAQTSTPTSTSTPTISPTPTATALPAMEFWVTNDSGNTLNYAWGETFYLNYLVRPSDNDLSDFSHVRVDVYLYLIFPDNSYYPFNKSFTLTGDPAYQSPTVQQASFVATSCGRLKFSAGATPTTGEYKFAGLLVFNTVRSRTYLSDAFTLNKAVGPTPTPTQTPTPIPGNGFNMYWTKRSVLPGSSAQFHYTIVPLSGVRAVDIYLGVITPADTLFFFSSTLRLKREITPIVQRERFATQVAGDLVLPLSAGIAEGYYDFLAAMVRAGDNVLDPDKRLFPGVVESTLHVGPEAQPAPDPIADTLDFKSISLAPCVK